MIFVLLSLSVILIFFYLGKHRRRYELGNKIKGPKGVPLIGNTELFSLPPEELFTHLTNLQTKYKDYYRLWLASEFWIVIYEPILIEKILNNPKLNKSVDYELLKCWLGNGLLTSGGSKWFARRKAITPAFHFKILEDFVEVFARQTDVFIEKIKKFVSFDVAPHLLLLTLDTICETAMGTSINAQTDIESEYVKAIHNVSMILYKRMFNPFLTPDIIFRFTKDYPILNEGIETIHKMTQTVISERRKQLQDNPNLHAMENMIDEFGRKKKMALLDVLLQVSIDGQPLTDGDIQEEVNTFMFAGHDTTGSSLSFLFYNVAKYPEIQHKVYEEIISVFGKNGTTSITQSNLNDLNYMDLVIKESLRIHTTVPFISRQVIEECKIGDITFPENTNASICVYALSHNPQIFPDPKKFIPERFEGEINPDKMHPFSFIPFSAGPRNCIGQKFAMLEIKTVLTKVIQNFEISLLDPEEELILVMGLVLKSQNGIKIQFKPRRKVVE